MLELAAESCSPNSSCRNWHTMAAYYRTILLVSTSSTRCAVSIHVYSPWVIVCVKNRDIQGNEMTQQLCIQPLSGITGWHDASPYSSMLACGIYMQRRGTGYSYLSSTCRDTIAALSRRVPKTPIKLTGPTHRNHLPLFAFSCIDDIQVWTCCALFWLSSHPCCGNVRIGSIASAAARGKSDTLFLPKRYQIKLLADVKSSVS
jgi:hypothetical protein